MVYDSGQTTLRGKVVDKFSGKPVECSLEFRPMTGNKFVVKSNADDGSYEVLIQNNVDYKLLYIADNVYREEVDFSVNSTESYNEKNMDFKVKVMASGNIVDEINIFEANSDKISANGEKLLKEFKIAMRLNRIGSFILVANAKDKNLASKRLNALKSHTKNWKRELERLDFQTGQQGENVQVKVKEVLDVFK